MSANRILILFILLFFDSVLSINSLKENLKINSFNLSLPKKNFHQNQQNVSLKLSSVKNRTSYKVKQLYSNKLEKSKNLFQKNQKLQISSFNSFTKNLKRFKRENHILINNGLTSSGLNLQDTNSFQPNVWTQELKNSPIADEEKQSSSDIEIADNSDEEDNEENDNLDTEKDADYEDDEENKKSRKKLKNRINKKKNKNSQNGVTVGLNTNLQTVNGNNSVIFMNETTAQNNLKTIKDYTSNYIDLISGPNNVTHKPGDNVYLRCIFEAKPKPKIKWYKNEAPIDKLIRDKYYISEKKMSSNKFQTRLKISKVDIHDTGYYQCRAINSNGLKAEGVGILKIDKTRPDIESNQRNNIANIGSSILDLESSSNSASDLLNLDNTIGQTRDSTFHLQESNVEIPSFQNYPRFTETNSLDTDYVQQTHNSIDGITMNSVSTQCYPYVGSICSQYLRNRTVLDQIEKQLQLEKLLQHAFRIIASAAGISPQCHRFTKPLLCYQSFHVCEKTQNDFSDQPSTNSFTSNLQQMQSDYHKNLDGTKAQLYSNSIPTYSNLMLNKHSSISLRQLCRDECEILEHDICSMEFTLAKLNPVEGFKSVLPNCEKLPRVGSLQYENCLRIGVTQDFYTPLTNHQCYLDKGETYRGNVNTTSSGKKCEVWSTVSTPNFNHPELSGSHNFCRNPKGVMSGPWCYVKNENQQTYKELCDFSKCHDQFWIYYLLTPVLAVLTLSLLIGSIWCTRRCQKNKSASIVEGICLSANELFAQQQLQHHFLQTSTNNSSAVPLRMTLPFGYGRQTNQHNPGSISTASSKQSNQSLLSNVLNSVANATGHPGRALGNAIGQSIKCYNSNNDSKSDTNNSNNNNLELKALLSNNESPTKMTSHYALSSMFPVNITGNPIANNLIHYPLHCIRILTRIYPRLNEHNHYNSLENTNSYHSNSSEDTPSTHLKSSLNYQFYVGQLSTSNQNTGCNIQPVVLRALKLTTDSQNITLFAELASQLASLDHENVIKMIGVAIGANNHSTIPQHFLIFEQFSTINLLNFLQQQSLPYTNSASNSTFNPNLQKNSNSNSHLFNQNAMVLDYCDLLQIAYQIACGMQYLSEHFYVHGDLAARNCYVTTLTNASPSSVNSKRLHIKIGSLRLQSLKNNNSNQWSLKNEFNKLNNKNKDFFKPNELHEEIVEEKIDDQDYFTVNSQQRALPIRWLPPESLTSLEFTFFSDVWSYGVTLWEIFTYGRQIPFASHTNAQAFDLIIAGRLLECPQFCEPALHALMLDCWREVPAQRSSFSELASRLSQLMANSSNNINSSRNWISNSNSTNQGHIVRNNSRVCSPMPGQPRSLLNKNLHGEDKVGTWLSSSEFNNSLNYTNGNAMKNTNLLKTNTMNSGSTYASSYCNQPDSPSYNALKNNKNQVEYDQPFVNLNDILEKNPIFKQQPVLSTFQKPLMNGNKMKIKTNHLFNYSLKNELHQQSDSSLNSKQEDYYERLT